MSDEQHRGGLTERVRTLAEVFAATDLLRVRIARDDEEIELVRHPLDRGRAPEELADAGAIANVPPVALDTIDADLVGIFHAGRPPIGEGDFLEGDRELAYIEALGIRNPVRSLGAGRIVNILCADGDRVEYGQPLFEIDRG